ncbi:hypothetical protein BLX87_05185 [Bacillus sp. VT-16-64]|nr:hypothetical protein BLX87_05185 [Bacillus sp. VT-16-64]
MKRHIKNIFIVAMMTITYTIILTYFFPQMKALLMLDKAVKFVEDLGQELAVTFNRGNWLKTSNNASENGISNDKEITKESKPTYYIKADLKESSYEIDGQMNVTIENPGTDFIAFYTYSYSWLPMKINKVVLNGEEVTFSYDKKQLLIQNPKEEKELTFSIEFITPVPREGTRFGYKEDVWLITTWYPMLGVLDEQQNWMTRPDPIGMGDPFLFNYADYVVEWSSSPSIKWVTSGDLTSDTIIENKRKTTWKVKNVRNFALAGSKNYTQQTLQFKGNTTVTIALTDEEKFSEVVDIVRFSFLLFQSLYGQLPYSNIAIVETGHGTNFALEYPNVAIFSKDMYANNEIEHWLPHEIGHLWWYNAVGVNEIKEGWIDEGLAELSVVLYLENRYSKSAGKQLRDQYRQRNQLLVKNSPHQTMAAGMYGFKNKQEFYDSWYARSADMFLTLRDTVGEEKFNYFLSTLYKTNIGQNIREDHIVQALEDSLNLKTNLFTNWVHEPYQQTKWDIEVISADDESKRNAVDESRK